MAKNLKQSLDNSLEYIRLSERQHQQILQEIVEEGKMKRKVLGSVILVTLLILLSLGMVYALFHSQIAELLQRNYTQDKLHELEQGKLAQMDESFHIKGVDFHFGEAILKDGNLFLAVDITTKEDIYLDSSGMEKQDISIPFYYSDINFESIGVDKDNLLPIKGYRLTLEEIDDKHYKQVYEFSPSFYLPENESIFIEVGLTVQKNRKQFYYTPDQKVLLEIIPKVEVPKLTKSNPAPAKLEDREYELIVSEDYETKGEVPIYEAVPQNLGEVLKPELFNSSKISYKGEQSIYFTDKEEVELYFTPDRISYSKYNGTYERTDHFGEKIEVIKNSLSNQMANLASFAFRNLPLSFGPALLWDTIPRTMPEQETLTHIRFAEAREKAESLLSAHGLEEYQLTGAIGMNLTRLQEQGRKYREEIKETDHRYVGPIDYEKATTAEEGYLLEFRRYGLEKATEGSYIAQFYITGEGIAYASIQDSYKKGEILRQSGKLQDPSTIAEALPDSIAKYNRYIERLQIISIRLCYQTKLEKTGLIFTPVWQVLYTTEENQEYISWANFDAVDGKLLDAVFK